jgi:hypothetical protein
MIKLIIIAFIMAIISWVGFLFTQSPTVMGFAMGCNLFQVIGWFIERDESNRKNP